ncbi:MAG: OmpA family protein [Myxococcota bacterium]
MLNHKRIALLMAAAVSAGSSWAYAQSGGTPEIPTAPRPSTEAAPAEAPDSDPEVATPEAEAASPEAEAASPEAEAAPPEVSAPLPSPEATTPPPATEAAPAPAPVSSPPAASAQASRPNPNRRRLSYVQPSPSGQTGILRVGAADSSAPGLLRLGLGFEFFSGSDVFAEGDENTRVAGVLSVSGSPIDFLELWLNIRAASNSNTLTSPNLLQSQGDLQFGAKGFYPVADLATVGVDAQLTLLSGIGEAGYDFGASEFRIRALLTSDLRKLANPLPIRGHLNLGFILDNSSSLLESGEELTNPERFALGVSEFNRFQIGVGVEVPVAWVTPYLEYSMEIPLDYLATPGVVITGRSLTFAQTVDPTAENAVARPALQRVIPQRLTPGVRVRPVDGLAIDVAIEIGLTPDQAVGVPAVPDYNVFTLVSYTLDPFDTLSGPSGPPVAVPVLVPEPTGSGTGTRIAGRVMNGESGEPVSGAIVRFVGGPPAATNEDGSFVSTDLPPGPVKVTVEKPGFASGDAEVVLIEGEESPLELTLLPNLVVGKVEGTVLDAAGAPVPNATVRAVPIGSGETQTLTAGDDGRVAAPLNGGEWRLTVSAPGFLRTGRRITVSAEQSAPEFAVQLEPRGEKGARVDGNRLELPEPLLYAKGETPPNATAWRGLDLVVDLLLADEGLRIEVAGHTDGRGNDLDNRETSINRAQEARQYLLEHGVPEDQVTAEGYGAARPLAPNLTRSGRERNRRIDFMVLE